MVMDHPKEFTVAVFGLTKNLARLLGTKLTEKNPLCFYAPVQTISKHKE